MLLFAAVPLEEEAVSLYLLDTTHRHFQRLHASSHMSQEDMLLCDDLIMDRSKACIVKDLGPENKVVYEVVVRQMHMACTMGPGAVRLGSACLQL